jgi:hypothetical protein
MTFELLPFTYVPGRLEGDDQVASIFADADASWVDESCVVGVAVPVFHFETPLFVSCSSNRHYSLFVENVG